jgi:hypothetical protein
MRSRARADTATQLLGSSDQECGEYVSAHTVDSIRLLFADRVASDFLHQCDDLGACEAHCYYVRFFVIALHKVSVCGLCVCAYKRMCVCMCIREHHTCMCEYTHTHIVHTQTHVHHARMCVCLCVCVAISEDVAGMRAYVAMRHHSDPGMCMQTPTRKNSTQDASKHVGVMRRRAT